MLGKLPPFFVPTSGTQGRKEVVNLTEQLTNLAEFAIEQKEEWRLDPVKSFALFEWQTVIRGEETFYRISESLEIRPYPNPLGFGGMWGGSSAKTLEDVAERKDRFFLYARQYERLGMTRFEEKELPVWNVNMDAVIDEKEAPHPLKRGTNQLVMELDD